MKPLNRHIFSSHHTFSLGPPAVSLYNRADGESPVNDPEREGESVICPGPTGVDLGLPDKEKRMGNIYRRENIVRVAELADALDLGFDKHTLAIPHQN